MPTLFDSHEEFNEWFSKDIENHAENKSAIDQGISQISTECSYASECTTNSIMNGCTGIAEVMGSNPVQA